MKTTNKRWEIYNRLFMVLCFVSIFAYYFEKNYTYSKNLFLAVLCLVLNLHIVVKCKNNKQLFMFSIILLYFNYSGLINYYFFQHSAVLGFEQCNTVQIKGIAIICICIFMTILNFGVDWKNTKCYEIESDSVNSRIIYYGIVIILLFLWYYCLDRGDLGTTYVSVNMTIFEYAYLLFILAIFFAKGDRKKELILTGILLLYILEDIYYGGRISSLEFILVFFSMVYYKWFTRKQLIIGVVCGVVLFGFVSVYRSAYSVKGLSLESVISYISEGRFSLDSASNALYTSFGAIKVRDMTSHAYQLEHFKGFLIDLLTGQEVGDYITLQRVIANHGLYNIGGGWCIGYAYFWFGIMGVIIYSLITVFVIRKLVMRREHSALGDFLYVVAIATLPRWYLYNLAALYRGILLFTAGYLLIGCFIKIGKFRITEKKGKEQ